MNMNNNTRWILSVLMSFLFFFGIGYAYLHWGYLVTPVLIWAMGTAASYILIGEGAQFIYDRIKQPEQPAPVPVKTGE